MLMRHVALAPFLERQSVGGLYGALLRMGLDRQRLVLLLLGLRPGMIEQLLLGSLRAGAGKVDEVMVMQPRQA